MTNLEIGMCVFVVLALLLMNWRAWVWANEAHKRLNEASEARRLDWAVLEMDMSRSIHAAHKDIAAEVEERKLRTLGLGDSIGEVRHDLRLLCEHLGVMIVQEPSRTVVRVKGAPEKSE